MSGVIDYELARKRLSEGSDHPVSFFGSSEKMRVDRDKRLVTGTATGAVVDLDGEVVLPGGMDDRLFPTVYKTIYLNHDLDLMVGSCRNVARKGDTLVSQIHVTTTGFGDDVLTMIGEEVITGQSFGFFILDASAPTAEERQKFGDYERTIRRWMPRELSVTPMPCCPIASDLAVSKSSMDAVQTRLGELVSKSAVRRSSAVAAGLLDTPTRRFFPVAPTVVVIGEETPRPAPTVLVVP